MRVFADSVTAYFVAGWRGILPVPADKKWPPPGGRPGEPSYTGAAGIDTDPATLARWASAHPDHSIALRMPLGVIGIDVDHYVKGGKAKTGNDDLQALVEQLGELPPTWASTARGNGEGPGRSRTLFYRVPAGRYRANLSPSIEVLQHHHRYAVVAPSINHEAGGARYQWYEPEGFGWVSRETGLPERLPNPNELPELPAAWVEYLREGATEAGPVAADGTSGAVLLAQLLADGRPPCPEVESALDVAMSELAGAAPGGRHDTGTGRAYQLVQLGAVGHPGIGKALTMLGELWAQITAGEDREGEWARMMLTAARKAVTALAEMNASAQIDRDPCALLGPGLGRLAEAYAGATVAHDVQLGSRTGPAPSTTTVHNSPAQGAATAHNNPTAPTQTPAEPPPMAPAAWSLWEHLGYGAFDPPGGHDQTLAEDVLARMFPVLRYASDAATWVLRGPQTWELAGDLAGWAVAALANMMPKGNIEAAEGSPERQRAERRKRLRTTSSANAVSAKMRSLVAAGVHPASVKLAELDADPEILWAGGIAWDLRASIEIPTPAALDPATPHLHATPLLPQVVPTPAWDEFCGAVWPDPEVRAWALQQLAVGLTGYSSAVVPILWGVTGSGKTSIVELLMSTLGTYADPVSSKLLSAMDNAHASIIFDLKGLRLAFIDEGPRAGTVATEQLKALTGGGRLKGNRMRENPVSFAATHTLVMTTNPEPNVSDPAVRRRIRLIPCNGDAEAVGTTRGALVNGVWRAEAPGVLAQMMGLAGRFLADQRATTSLAAAPLQVRYLAEDLAAAQNVIALWIDAEMVADERGTKASELLHAYTAWSRTLRAPVLTAAKFGRELTDLGYPIIKRMDANYRGLRHKDETALCNPHGLPVPPPQDHRAQPVPNAASAPTRGSKTAADAETSGPRSSTSAEAPSTRAPMEGLSAQSGAKPSSNPPSVVDSSTIGDPTVSSAKEAGGLLEGSWGVFEQPSIGSDQPLFIVYGGMEGSKGNTTVNTDNQDHIENDQDNQKDTKYIAAKPSIPSSRPPTASPAIGPPPSEPNDLGGHLRAVARAAGTHLPDDHLRRTGTPQASSAAPVTESETPVLVARRALVAAVAVLDAFGETRTLTPAGKAAKGEARKAVTAARRELTAAEKLAAKEATKAAEIAAAAGPLIELPAVGIRGRMPHTVDLAEAVAVVRRAYARSGALTVDSEGSGYPIGHQLHRLSTMQLGDLIEGAVFDAADPWHLNAVFDLMREAPMLHAHNAVADLIELAHAKVIDWRSAWDRMFDTVLPAKLSDPTSTGNEEGLKRLGPAVLGDLAVSPAAQADRMALWKAAGWLTDVSIDTPPQRNGWAQVDKRSATMVRYALCDVFDTAPLYRRLPVVPEGLLARERELQRLCARVSLDGLRLDADHVARLHAEHTAARDPLRARLGELGIDNPGSSKQVADRLIAAGMTLPRTDAGNSSVAEGVLESLRHEGWGPEVTEVLETVLRWRHHNTAINMFTRPFLLLIEHGDGRVRPTIYTLGADTGRMSCVRENLQKLSREGGVRAMIIADEGMLQVGADLAGIELRMAAALSGDENLKQIILESDERPNDRLDIHWRIARQIFGPDATKANRYTIKPGVFGKIYGGGIPTLAAQMGCSQALAKAMSQTLDEFAPQLARWSKQVQRAVQRGNTTFETYSGRVIHLDKRLPHKAPNWIIQGTSREVIVDGILRWGRTQWGEHTLLPVHDEVNSWVPAAQAPAATVTLLDCLNCTVLGMPVRAEAAAPSSYWADAA